MTRRCRSLVTGGAGFIGSHVVDELLARDGEVTVLDDLSSGTLRNLVHALASDRTVIRVGDVRDRVAVEAALQGVDVVYHLAGVGVRHSLRDPGLGHEVNATGTLTVVDAAHRQDVSRFVHVSTSEVLGAAQYVPMDESHPTWPETVHGASKLAGEAYARAYHRTHSMPVVVVRPFNTYGPRGHYAGDSGELLPRAAVRMLAGERPVVFGDGEQTRDFMYVTDTARAIVHLGDVAGLEGETFNVGTGSETSINEVVQVLAEELDRLDLTPRELAGRPGDVHRLQCDPRKLAQITGFLPEVSLAEGVHRLVQHLRAEPEDVASMAAQVHDVNWSLSPGSPPMDAR